MTDRVSAHRSLLRGVGLRVAGIAALMIFGVVLARSYRDTGRTVARAAPPDASVPSADRIKVEVLNATHVRGLARRATRHLRDRGFDVLYLGTATEQLDSTLVLDRSGNPDRARRVVLSSSFLDGLKGPPMRPQVISRLRQPEAMSASFGPKM